LDQEPAVNNEIVQDDQDVATPLRRSTHISRPPAYLDNFQTNNHQHENGKI